MKLEDQVISLELAKRLKELGVKQESYFFWESVEDACGVPPSLVERPKNLESKKGSYNHGDEWQKHYYAAFTVAELGEMLPKNRVWYTQPGFLERAWTCTVMHSEIESQYRQFADTEAEARGLMFQYLIKNNLY